jgi:hypothetical protein
MAEAIMPDFLISLAINDANLNNTKDLATTLGHETSHAIDNQDPSIDTNPQNNASKADNETYNMIICDIGNPLPSNGQVSQVLTTFQ